MKIYDIDNKEKDIDINNMNNDMDQDDLGNIGADVGIDCQDHDNLSPSPHQRRTKISTITTK